MKKTIALFFLSILPLLLEAASPLKIDISAKSAILMNAETGAVLWGKNEHASLYPASTTKMFTALYALEKHKGNWDEIVTASQEAVSCVHPTLRRKENGQHPPYRLEFGGTHMGIKVGEELPFKALMYGLMLVSGNDAANVIAEHISGDVTTFLRELNRFAKEKGCLNTQLYTPHGLPHAGHKTTAYDMAIFAKEALKNPRFREVVKATQYTRPTTNKQAESILHQHNALMRPGRFHYPKAVGIKTGYTLSGGYTLVAAAEDKERKLIVVLLGCEKIEQRYKEAIALFEAGFQEKKVSRTLFSRGSDLFTQQVKGAKAPLQAYLQEDMILTYYPSEEPVFKTSIAWIIPRLSIQAGQKVGEIQVFSAQGKQLTSAPLYAIKSVEATLGYRLSVFGDQIKQGGYLAYLLLAIGALILAGALYYATRRKG